MKYYCRKIEIDLKVNIINNLIKNSVVLLLSVSAVFCSFIEYYDFGKDRPSPHQRNLLTEGYEWRNASHGEVPEGSFIGGKNLQGKSVYIVRALVAPPNVGLIPGRLDDGDNCANVNFKGKDLCINEYDVLNGHYYIWVFTKKKTELHPDKVVAGYEYNLNTHLYVCRIFLFHNFVKFDAIGKLNGDTCWISPEVASQGAPSKELKFKEFEILVGAVDPGPS